VKVLFTSPALFGAGGVFGGGERYALRLAGAVAERLGGATLLAAAHEEVDTTRGALRIVARRPWRWVSGQRANPLPSGLARAVGRADVVHCFQRHIVMTSAALVTGRLRSRPVFITDLGGGGWDISAWTDTSRWAAGMLHLSRYAQEVAGRAGRTEDRIIHGGADAGAPDYSAGPAAGAGPGSVLFVGRLVPHKGADVLIAAARAEWEVRIIGSPLDQGYVAELRALAAGKNVTFVADAGDDALEAAYAGAAVVVVPSLERDRYGGTTRVAELLGLVALEAAARGLPVVASRVASLPEVVEDGHTGRLVDPGDAAALRRAVDSLLADASLRRRFGAAARERALSRFTWEAAAEVAIDCYRRALAR
jgi:glycosyltransferase involved in cell wall biosynthesis